MNTAVGRTGQSPDRVRRRTVKIMVVDDSLVTRTILTRTIDAEPDLEIVRAANSAEQAIAALEETHVDVILLDLEMPGIGGLKGLPEILARARGAQVLIVSALTQEGAEHTLAALSMGATDTLLKPRTGNFDEDYRRTLISKVRSLGGAVRDDRLASPEIVIPVRKASVKGGKPAKVLAFAGSTGGIHALCSLLQQMPERIGLPILVTQHLPASFLPVFARQLELASGRPATVATNGTLLQPDKILIAPADGHMTVVEKGKRLQTKIETGRAPSGCMPSADPMYSSLASTLGGHAMAIVLSGMGNDGVLGATELANAGGRIVAQDRQSASVWGMPRAVVQAGLASAVLPPERIALTIAANVDRTAWK